MSVELHELSGDVADLIDYRLDEHGLHPALWFPEVGTSCIVVTCDVRGFGSFPAKFYPDPLAKHLPHQTRDDFMWAAELPPCSTCGSTDPDVIEGLPFCPNDFHYPESDWAAWRCIAYRAFGVTIVAGWLAALFLYIAGVLPQ